MNVLQLYGVVAEVQCGSVLACVRIGNEVSEWFPFASESGDRTWFVLSRRYRVMLLELQIQHNQTLEF